MRFPHTDDACCTAQDIEESRRDLARDSLLFAELHDLPHDTAGSSRHGNDHFFDAVMRNHPGNLRNRTEHRYTADPLADFLGVVVHKAHRIQAELKVGLQFAGHHDAGRTGSGNEHWLCAVRLFPAARNGIEDSNEEADAGNVECRQECAEEREGPRKAVGPQPQREHNEEAEEHFRKS